MLIAMQLFSIGALYAAEITVEVSRNPVQINESVDITFNVDGDSDGEPDFSPLQTNFEILSQGSNSQVSIVNGSISRSNHWTVTVMPKTTGALVIPSIDFGSESSPASILRVTEKSDGDDQLESSNVFLEVEASPKDPYVQSQVIFTVRVYHRVGLAHASLSEPELSDAVIEPLQKDSKYRIKRGNYHYEVFERRYTIFPQRSGTLEIAPIRLDAQIITGRSSGGFFGRNITRTERFVSDPLALTVRPIPQSFTGKHWLPANSLELTQSWSDKLTHARVGEPLTQTIAIQAQGLLKSQLPSLSALEESLLNSADIKVYPDQPVLTQAGSPDGVISRREEKNALIPGKPGTVELPAIELPWWNIQTDRMEIARIPASSVVVSASTKTTATPSDKLPSMTDQHDLLNESDSDSLTQQAGNSFWQWLALGFGLCWLITLMLLIYIVFYQRRRADQTDASVLDVNWQQRGKVEKALKNACLNNLKTETRDAILGWAKLRWADNPPVNLSEIGRRIPELQTDIEGLQQALYNASSIPWDGHQLWETFKANRGYPNDQLKSQETGLAPLYKA